MSTEEKLLETVLNLTGQFYCGLVWTIYVVTTRNTGPDPLNPRPSTALLGCSCVVSRVSQHLLSPGEGCGAEWLPAPYPQCWGERFFSGLTRCSVCEQKYKSLQWGVQKNGQPGKVYDRRKTSRGCHSWPFFILVSDPFSFVCCTQYNGREHLDSSDSNQICMHIADN